MKENKILNKRRKILKTKLGAPRGKKFLQINKRLFKELKI